MMKRIPLSAEGIKEAIDIIKRGGVVAIPTDTVYGLVADATNPEAVCLVYAIKKRKNTKPLPLFVSSIAMAKNFARITAWQENFLQKVWPGKVTVIMQSRGVLPLELNAQNTIGLRQPNSELAQELLLQTQVPLTSTSANLSGNISLRSASEVAQEFVNNKEQPDLLLDAGDLPYSRPSQVIDITQNIERVLRA